MFARLVGTRVLADEFGHPVEETAGLMERHLGTCLDCCHSAVEFEEAALAVELANMGGPLGKIQFSSALRLEAPAAHPAARAPLLGLDEPRFLHQVTARTAGSSCTSATCQLREAAGDAEGPWAAPTSGAATSTSPWISSAPPGWRRRGTTPMPS